MPTLEQEQIVEMVAGIIADSPLIDAPKLPAPAWMGLSRRIVNAIALAAQDGEAVAGSGPHQPPLVYDPQEGKLVRPGNAPFSRTELAELLPAASERTERGEVLPKVFAQVMREAAKLFTRPADDALAEKYNELIMAVARKWPDETRHQTALRYICQAEEPRMDAGVMAEAAAALKGKS